MLLQSNLLWPHRPPSGIFYCAHMHWAHARACVHTHTHTKLSNSSVDIVTRLLTGQSRFSSWEKEEIFLLCKASTPVLGPTPPPTQELLRTLTPEIEQSQCEANHPPAPGTKVQNECSCTSTPVPCPHGVDRYNLTFTFTCMTASASLGVMLHQYLDTSYLQWTNAYRIYHIRELTKVQNCYIILA
jgi:hypothetical protein